MQQDVEGAGNSNSVIGSSHSGQTKCHGTTDLSPQSSGENASSDHPLYAGSGTEPSLGLLVLLQ